ncbi:MAG: helix-turn-helix domain-containing protein [Ktedonobacteraceae bacterium]
MVRLKVKEVAQAKGINMSKLSRKADISYHTVQAIAHDPYHDVSLSILHRIARALGVSICDLIVEEEDNI